MRLSIIIPARNEEACIRRVVEACRQHAPPNGDLRVVVCDNGSADDTEREARRAGAEVVREPQRGYGAACLRAVEHLDDWSDVLVFVDGDGSTDPAQLPALLRPLQRREADLVIGRRVHCEPGSKTIPQRLGTWWFCQLLRWRWGADCRDLGPFRAITRSALERLRMSDRTWGWTLEMQIKALLCGLRTVEVPVSWRRRRGGRSKISGTVRGVACAGARITWTFGRYVLHRLPVRRGPRDLVIAFVKFPHPGAVKTRLAASVGAQQAARIYRRLAHNTHRQLLHLQRARVVKAWVCGTGGDLDRFRSWLPGAHRYIRQPQGDLGTRLRHAFRAAFSGGARRVAAIGTDCPNLDAAAIDRAIGALDRSDVSVVPNPDGGYALIAAGAEHPDLFKGIEWSTSAVLQQTRRRAAGLGLRVTELDPVADVDTVEDLVHLPPLLSIIIPVLNEQRLLGRNLPALMEQLAAEQEPVEVIVVDGGSCDDSLRIARRCGAVVKTAPRGRGAQLSAGTTMATGDWLWYLHADCVPAGGAVRELLGRLRRDVVHEWGFFPGRIASRGTSLRVIECGMNLRARWLSLPFGDQGLFVHRRAVRDLGGFAAPATLEDLEAVLRWRRLGPPLRITRPLAIDARRWLKHGPWRVTLQNWRTLAAYFLQRRPHDRPATREHPDTEPERPLNLELQKGALS